MKCFITIIILCIYSLTTTLAQPKPIKQYYKLIRCADRNNTSKAIGYLNKGYNIDARDNAGKTPLLFCLQTDKVSFARFLIEKGADIKVLDNQQNSTLHYAIENCSDNDITIFLVEKGLDINSRNNSLYTPFHFSILKKCNTSLPFYLLEKGADFTLITNNKENCLHLSMESNCDTLSNFFINKGLDITLRDSKGNTTLNKALAAGNSKMAVKLINLGADINNKNTDGQSSLYYAIMNGDGELFNLLLAKNVDLQQSSTEKPYLTLAAERENTTIVESLLLKGAKNPMDCNEHESCYNTAFIYSVNARIVSENQKLGYFQNSLNIYKVAKEKYQDELNKIRAKNTAKFCGEVCLMTASSLASPYSYYNPGYYGGSVNYEGDRRNYLNERIKRCNAQIQYLETTISCINTNSAQGQSIANCYK